jgi:hypothetical protein
VTTTMMTSTNESEHRCRSLWLGFLVTHCKEKHAAHPNLSRIRHLVLSDGHRKSISATVEARNRPARLSQRRPAIQANCTLAQDMLDVYNENVQTDISLPPLLGGPHGTHVQCDLDYHQRMHDLSVMYENAVAALKKKGDPFSQRDAIAGFRNQIIGVSNAWIRCLQQPLHTIATPSTKNPAGG